MSMVINTNSSALTALKNLEQHKLRLDSSIQKLSSGLKINQASDDAADLAIATRMAAQIGSLIQASANAQAGVSLINIADGALGSIAESLTSLRALAIQAANGTLTSSDRASINTDAVSLLAQINSVVAQTNFNELNLIDGTLNTTLQVGTEAGDTIAIQVNSANTANIGAIIVTGSAVTALNTGDLLINGEAISATVSDGVSFDSPNASAIAVANAINTSGTDADVHAIANPTVTGVSTFAASANDGGTIIINGVATSPISITGTLASNTANAIAAINKLTTQTGVTAATNSAGLLVMTAQDGRNITVAYGVGILHTDLGAVAASTTSSTVTLTSSNPITIGGVNPNNAGLTAGTTSTLTALSTTDLNSQANAISSLAVIDGAIDTISNLRATLGAIQNRLYSAIDNLGNSAVNLQDAKSQIMDTDFAAEMTNFAKSQILQQAGVAMLAEANAEPQAILKLLQ